MLAAMFNACFAFAACSSGEPVNESESLNETSGKTLVVY